MRYECGCSVHFGDKGLRIAVDDFCEATDWIFTKVVEAGFTNDSWRWMNVELFRHYKTIRQAAGQPIT